MRYLVLMIFVTNDWEGAYMHTRMRWIECEPKDIEKRLGRLKVSGNENKRAWEVCAEILVFDETLVLVKRIEVDWVEIRDKEMKNVRLREVM